MFRATAVICVAIPQGPNCPRESPKVVAAFPGKTALLEILSATVATNLLQAQKDTAKSAATAG